MCGCEWISVVFSSVGGVENTPDQKLKNENTKACGGGGEWVNILGHNISQEHAKAFMGGGGRAHCLAHHI